MVEYRYGAMFIAMNMIKTRVVRLCSANKSMPLFLIPRSIVGIEYYVWGHPELYTMQILKECLEKNIPAGSIALDVGANIGAVAIAISPYFHRVFAFEPNPAVFFVLKANIMLNGIKNIEAIEHGLSDVDAISHLHIPVDGDVGFGSLERSYSSEDIIFSVSVRVGSDLLRERDISQSIKYIKIDVEGHEKAVIRGLETVILEHKPILSFEANDCNAAQETIDLLSRLGYRYFYNIQETWEANSKILKFIRVILGWNKVKMVEFNSEGVGFYKMIIAAPVELNSSI